MDWVLTLLFLKVVLEHCTTSFPSLFSPNFICTSLVLDFLINLSCNGDAIAHISVFTSSVTNLHATTSFVSKPYGL